MIERNSSHSFKHKAMFKEEDEIIFLPTRQFQIVSRLNQGNGLHIIQLKAIEPLFPINETRCRWWVNDSDAR